MAEAICFWSLLSLQKLDFLHVSPTMGSQTVLAGYDATIEDLILHHSLLDFIHPDEWLLAKQDLTTFLQRKTLAGAVTRCRLRSFASIAKRGAYPSQLDDDKESTWVIVDMVMYIVTEGIVLAFFHNQDNFQRHSTCGESYFTPKDASQLLTILQNHQPLITTTNNSSGTINGDNNNTMDRVLQVYDKCSKQRLLSWPPSDQYYNPEDGQHLYTSPPQEPPTSISLSTQQRHQYHSSIYDRSSCMQHIHSNSVIPHASTTINGLSTKPADSTNSSYCQLERIIISYGCIIFYSFQINYRQPTKSLRHLQTTGDSETRKSIDVLHLSENRKLPEIELPSIITNNTINHSTVMPPPIDYIYPHHQHFHHLHHLHHHPVSTSMYQQKKQNKRCVRCFTTESPEWRRGPTGHKTLCNACGLRYSRLMSKKHTPAPRRCS